MYVGTQSNDVLATGFGNYVEAFGNAGNDIITINGTNSWVSGDDGNDEIYGGYGSDTIYGDLSGSNPGDDLIYGGFGADTIWGKEGNDTLYGNAGSDIIHAGSGNDIIYGGAGDDDIRANAGVDTIYGGQGKDSFWSYVSSWDGDTIYDLEAEENLVFQYGLDGQQDVTEDDINIEDLGATGTNGDHAYRISLFEDEVEFTVQSTNSLTFETLVDSTTNETRIVSAFDGFGPDPTEPNDSFDDSV